MPNELRPTVVLGVGSFGSKVVSRLRTLVFEELGYPGLPIFSFISLSTHSDHENVEIDPPHNNYSEEWERLTQLKASFTTNIKERLKSLLGSGPLAEQQPGWRDWLDPVLTDLAKNTYDAGAGNVRMMGRALLWLNWIDGSKIKPKLKKAVNRVTNPQNKAEANKLLVNYERRKTGAPVAAGTSFVKDVPPNIFIVTSLCGGTGSGMFLDLAYYLRHHHPAAKVFGLFNVPDVESSGDMSMHNVVVNAYAALAELDYYMRDSTMFDFRFPGESYPIYTNDMPYDSVRLISPSSRTDNDSAFRLFDNADADFIAEMEYICATSLFFDLISGADSAKAGLLVDFTKDFDGFLKPKSQKPHRVRFLSAMGTATAQYPKYQVAGAAACRLIKQKLSQWNGSNQEPTPPERLKTLAEQWRIEILKECLPKLQGIGSEDINQEWESAFDGSCARLAGLRSRNHDKFCTALENCPPRNPVARRFLAGGPYHELLETRQGNYQAALISTLYSRIHRYLKDLSNGQKAGNGIIANLNDLINVVNQLEAGFRKTSFLAPATPVSLRSVEGISKPQNPSAAGEPEEKVPGEKVPEIVKCLRDVDDGARQTGRPNIIREMEEMENSFASLVLFKQPEVRKYYQGQLAAKRRELIKHFRDMLQKDYRRLLNSVTKAPHKNASDYLERELGNLARIRNNLDSFLIHVERREGVLRHLPRINNLVFLFPGSGTKAQDNFPGEIEINKRTASSESEGDLVRKDTAMEREIEKWAATWTAKDWSATFDAMNIQQDGKDSFLNAAATDSQGGDYTLLQELHTQVMSRLVGRMNLSATGFSLSGELKNTGADIAGLGKRSEVLIELDPAYAGWAGAQMPKLVVGGTPDDQKEVVAALDSFTKADGNNKLYDYTDHLLHLFQEEVGLAMDDMAFYHIAEKQYRKALDNPNVIQSIVHTHKDPSYFDIDIYINLSHLLTDKPHQPSPLMITTCLKPVREVVLQGAMHNQYFSWEEEGLEETIQFDPEDVWRFARELAHSNEGTNIFLSRVREAITLNQFSAKEIQGMFAEGRDVWATVPAPDGKHRWSFDELFTNNFARRRGYPWF